MGPVAKFFECALSAFLTLPFSSPCHRMKKSVGKQHFQCCPSSLGNISYIPQWEWWDGWKLLEVITIPSEMQVALSLLSNISAWCYVTKRPGGVAQILIYLWTGECPCRAPFTYFLINYYFLCGSGLLVFNAVKQSWSERHVAWIMQ